MMTKRVTLEFDTPKLAADFAQSVRASGEVILDAGDSGVEATCAVEIVEEKTGIERLTEAIQKDEQFGRIIQFGYIAADLEAMKPPQISRVQNPDGSAQPETSAEYTRRLIETVVRYLVDNRLLNIPSDIEEILEAGVPIG